MFPRWVYVVWFVLAVSVVVFTFKECGAKTLLLGNGASGAAFMGMCD